MNNSEAEAAIQQAVALIQVGNMADARQILRPLCEANNADAWYWAAQTTRNPEQQRYALKRALQIDPQHEAAARQSVGLPGETDTHKKSGLTSKPASATAPAPAEAIQHTPRTKKSAKKSSQASRRVTTLRMIIIVLSLLVAGLSGLLIFQRMTYTVLPPALGPYYVRSSTPYIETAPEIYDRDKPYRCKSYLVTGRITDRSHHTVRVWLNDFDNTTFTDDEGTFHIEIPSNSVFPHHLETSDPVYKAWEWHLRIRLYDADGSPQSGISNVRFAGSCAVYVEYWRETASGLKFGSPDERPPTWRGSLSIAYSELTTTPLLICDFVGFTGTAYDDYGPISDFWVQFRLQDSDPPRSLVTTTNLLDGPMGKGWWYISAEPHQKYDLWVSNPSNLIAGSEDMVMPAPQGCDKNLILVSIMPADRRTESSLPPLPDWFDPA